MVMLDVTQSFRVIGDLMGVSHKSFQARVLQRERGINKGSIVEWVIGSKVHKKDSLNEEIQSMVLGWWTMNTHLSPNRKYVIIHHNHFKDV
jgi:hypothetical protein